MILTLLLAGPDCVCTCVSTHQEGVLVMVAERLYVLCADIRCVYIYVCYLSHNYAASARYLCNRCAVIAFKHSYLLAGKIEISITVPNNCYHTYFADHVSSYSSGL